MGAQAESAASDRQRVTAVRRQRRASDVAGFLRAQEDDGPGDLFRLTGASEMDVRQQALVVDFVTDICSQSAMHRRIDHARTDEVDSNALRGQFRRDAGGQSYEGMLGSDVRRSGRGAQEGID